MLILSDMLELAMDASLHSVKLQLQSMTKIAKDSVVSKRCQPGTTAFEALPTACKVACATLRTPPITCRCPMLLGAFLNAILLCMHVRKSLTNNMHSFRKRQWSKSFHCPVQQVEYRTLTTILTSSCKALQEVLLNANQVITHRKLLHMNKRKAFVWRAKSLQIKVQEADRSRCTAKKEQRHVTACVVCRKLWSERAER